MATSIIKSKRINKFNKNATWPLHRTPGYQLRCTIPGKYKKMHTNN